MGFPAVGSTAARAGSLTGVFQAAASHGGQGGHQGGGHGFARGVAVGAAVGVGAGLAAHGGFHGGGFGAAPGFHGGPGFERRGGGFAYTGSRGYGEGPHGRGNWSYRGR